MHLRRHPRYHVHGPRPAVVHVRAGELLYLPSQHFHHVQQVAVSSTATSPSRTTITTTAIDDVVDRGHGCCLALNYWYDPRHDSRHVVQTRLLRPDTRTGT